jgi:hypothetical protein
MKLGVSYNVFDSEELLEGSINQIKKLSSFISVVYQKKSNYGNDCSDNLENVLFDLKDRNLIDELVEYTPDIDRGAHYNEVNKRNIGLDLSRKNLCTHHISMDCDEYYITEDFEKIMNDIDDNGYESSFCQMKTYYKDWEHQYLIPEEYYVPLIFKIKEDVNYRFNEPCPVDCDPTRKMKVVKFKIYERSEIEMHHGSYIREDIERKLINSSALVNYYRNLDELINHYKNWVDGDYGFVAGIPCKKIELIKVEKKFL